MALLKILDTRKRLLLEPIKRNRSEGIRPSMGGDILV
jgi:hypothetical protein